MLESLRGSYPYWVVILLVVMGLYGMVAKHNLFKKVISMAILQSAIVLFFIVTAYKRGATVPIYDPQLGTAPDQYANPLPHTLMLTAIVVGVATVGVALAFLVLIYRRFRTLEEDVLIERMK